MSGQSVLGKAINAARSFSERSSPYSCPIGSKVGPWRPWREAIDGMRTPGYLPVVTDQELKELLAKTAVEVAETSRNVATLMADNQETDRQLKETDRQLKETGKETDRRLRLLGEQLGGLGNKFGSFTEGLAYPSLYRILTEDFHLDTVAYRVRQRRNGAEQEFDMVGSTNGKDQRVVLVEIKSHLTESEVKKFENKLKAFRDFFPEHRGKALYGLIAAVDVTHGLTARVARRGLYLAVAHDGTFALASPAHFKPKKFS